MNKNVIAVLISVCSCAGYELTWLHLYLPGRPNMHAGSICVLWVWAQHAVFALAKRELVFGTQMGVRDSGKSFWKAFGEVRMHKLLSILW